MRKPRKRFLISIVAVAFAAVGVSTRVYAATGGAGVGGVPAGGVNSECLGHDQELQGAEGRLHQQ